jgi:hypothetical protein
MNNQAQFRPSIPALASEDRFVAIIILLILTSITVADMTPVQSPYSRTLARFDARQFYTSSSVDARGAGFRYDVWFNALRYREAGGL